VYCHGDNGKGIPNLGKDLTTSEFVAGQTDRQLIDFIKRGRMPGDPANTTGMPMPPNGGNAGLSDQDLANVVAYIRSLRQ
jgi:disulfide bond formation protein DsbB